MSPVVFPVSFEELDATVDFSEIAEECRPGNGYEVRAYQVRHPGGALGYRFTEKHDDHRALVYISDNELGPGAKYDTRARWREGLIEFVRNARVLIHDTMYTAEEYDHFRGWGHSTYDEAVDLAIEAGVEQLVLYHHKPERSDDEVDRRVDSCRAIVARCGATLEILAAAEGMTLLV
jgi:ribonuclease BN (tRNA processing enzyme)